MGRHITKTWVGLLTIIGLDITKLKVLSEKNLQYIPGLSQMQIDDVQGRFSVGR